MVCFGRQKRAVHTGEAIRLNKNPHIMYAVSATDDVQASKNGSRLLGEAGEKILLVLLMTVLPQTLFAFVRGYLMSFPLLTARHNTSVLKSYFNDFICSSISLLKSGLFTTILHLSSSSIAFCLFPVPS